MEMINAEFRVIMNGDKEIRQWRDKNKKDDEWKNVVVEEKKKYKQSTRCESTDDMFGEKI